MTTRRIKLTDAGAEMRSLRHKSGDSQAVLGEKIGVSRATISRIERSALAEGPGLEHLDAIAKVYGRTLTLNFYSERTA